MNSKTKNAKAARGVCMLLGILAIGGVCAAAAFPCGPFGHCRARPNSSAAQIVAPAPIAAAQTVTAAVERPCILPWNCDKKCCPRETVSINVSPAPQPPSVAPVNVSLEPAARPPFPFGVLLAVLVPVILISSILAFVLRVQSGH